MGCCQGVSFFIESMIVFSRRRLPFLFLVLVMACGQPEPVSIVWKEEKATGLIIRQLRASETDLLKLEVRLVREYERAPVLGVFKLSGEEITFTPIVPLTKGLTYELLEDGKAFGEITIPASEAPAPEIIGIYPGVDTIPENLLKFHIQFSQPMMEGKSAQFVKLIENGKDTLDGTFLDLQPELWNEAGTVLTLWLDPGRIKLDLIPNKELGNPLALGAQYALVIMPGWSSKDGVPLRSVLIKTLYVGERDDRSPDVDMWQVQIPGAATRDQLNIGFGESLDWLLANECILVMDAASKPVPGLYSLNDEVSGFTFVPQSPWNEGRYSITVESRLEDLAGNNLNRLFEVDLNKPGSKTEPRSSYMRTFEIK